MLPKNVHKIEKYGFYLLTKYIIVVYKHGSLTRREKSAFNWDDSRPDDNLV